MAKPNELLATSLAELRGVTQNGTRSVVKSEELSRVHRERLQDNGFLEEIMKGWLAVNSRPSANNRIDAARDRSRPLGGDVQRRPSRPR